MSDDRFIWEDGDLVIETPEEEAARTAKEAGEADDAPEEVERADVPRDEKGQWTGDGPVDYAEKRPDAKARSQAARDGSRSKANYKVGKGWEDVSRDDKGQWTGDGEEGDGNKSPADGPGGFGDHARRMASKHDPAGDYWRDPEAETIPVKGKPPEHVLTLAKAMKAEAEKEAPAMNALMARIAKDTGGELVGAEKAEWKPDGLHNVTASVKGDESLARKGWEDFNTNRAKYPTVGAALEDVGDTLRYTLNYKPEDYAAGVARAMKRYTDAGYEVKLDERGRPKFKNTWGKPGKMEPAYQGINVNFVAPSGRTIEVQFHTPESFHVKEYINHLYYETARLSATKAAIKQRAGQVMVLNQATVTKPPNAHLIVWSTK